MNTFNEKRREFWGQQQPGHFQTQMLSARMKTSKLYHIFFSLNGHPITVSPLICILQTRDLGEHGDGRFVFGATIKTVLLVFRD